MPFASLGAQNKVLVVNYSNRMKRSVHKSVKRTSGAVDERVNSSEQRVKRATSFVVAVRKVKIERNKKR